jgi:hypothetical protein
MIQTEHGQAEKGNLVQEIEKGFFDLFDSGVVIEMIFINIRNNGNGGHELEKRTITLICLGHQKLTLAQPGVASKAVQSSTDHNRWIESSRGKDCCNQGGRCRLSVRSGNGNPTFIRINSASISALGSPG